MTVIEGSDRDCAIPVASCLGLHQHDLGLLEAAHGTTAVCGSHAKSWRSLDRLLVGEHRKLPTDVQTGAPNPVFSRDGIPHPVKPFTPQPVRPTYGLS